jgi:hypothetical protein
MHTALLALFLKGLLLALGALFAALWSTSDMGATVLEWLKDVAPVVVSLAAVFVSIAVFFVTRSFNEWQKLLAKQKLRHDLYDRRMAIYVAFRELLIALPEQGDDEIKALLRKSNIARFEAPFLFDNVNLPNYLEQLCTEITKDVVGTSMYLDALSKQVAAIQNTPEAFQGRTENTTRHAAAIVNIPERHLKEINQQFAELKLTDFWK